MAGRSDKTGTASAPSSAAGRRPSAVAAPQAMRATRQRRRKLLGVLISVILVAAAFAGGFFARGNEALMESLGISTGGSREEVNPGMTVHGLTQTSISARIAEVEGILSQLSLDSYDLDTLTAALMRSFVDTTEDPYLRYFSPERYESFVRESTTGAYAGIGVLFGEYQGQAYAVDVFDGSVAQASGVQEGDFVVAVDGDSSQHWSSTEVQNAIGQAEGGSIVITWRRPPALSASGGDEFITTLAVAPSDRVPNVSIQLEDQVGYIQVLQLSSNVASLVMEGIQRLEAEGAEAYVLDLRNCSGGYLTQAVELADLFVKSGIIVSINGKESSSTKNATNSQLTDKPLVLLVNGSTSAAAE
ncbi:MAG: peptidase, partial [Eggerthellaceae bacterium]|nr:peptidase [Eggerthellaceae bacterium]